MRVTQCCCQCRAASAASMLRVARLATDVRDVPGWHSSVTFADRRWSEGASASSWSWRSKR